jgi:ubiquitin C-terminal hydrolase
MAEAVETKTTEEILGESPAKAVLTDIFADLHPGLIDTSNDVSSIFTAQSANEFLGQLLDFEALLSEEDDFQTTIQKVQSQIDEAEAMRDQLSTRSYRSSAATAS